MTTYAYKLILNESEVIMLKASLKLMIEKCEAILKEADTNPDKKTAPYLAQKIDAESLLERLYENSTLTSTSNL